MKERTALILVILAFLAVGIGAFVALNVDLFPELASARGPAVDSLFRLMIGISVVIFLIVQGGLIYAVLRFRRKHGEEGEGKIYHGNYTLELIWTLIPAVIVTIIAVTYPHYFVHFLS